MRQLIDAAWTVLDRVRKARRQSATDMTEHEQILKAIRRQGYFVIKGYYDRQTCADLVEELRRVFSDYERVIWQDALKSDTRAYAAERVSEPVRRFHEDPLLAGVSQHYIPNQRCFFTMANRVRPVPGNLGSGGGWHRDTPLERQFKAMLYLVDVGDKGGAFEYLPQSHHVSYLVRTIAACGVKRRQNRLSEEDVARIIKHFKVEPVRFTAPAGTLILFDSSGIHRGRPIEEGERFAMSNYYFDIPTIESHKVTGKFTKYFVDRDPNP